MIAKQSQTWANHLGESITERTRNLGGFGMFGASSSSNNDEDDDSTTTTTTTTTIKEKVEYIDA